MPNDTIRDMLREQDLLDTIREFTNYDVDEFNRKFKDSILYKTMSITISDEINNMAKHEGRINTNLSYH